MLSASSLSALCGVGFGASVRSGASARGAAPPQQQRRQRLVDAPLSSKIGLRRHRQCRPSLLSVFQASASAAQSTELPPELKRIVTAFSMVRSLLSIVERDGVESTREDSLMFFSLSLTTTTKTKTPNLFSLLPFLSRSPTQNSSTPSYLPTAKSSTLYPPEQPPRPTRSAAASPRSGWFQSWTRKRVSSRGSPTPTRL